MKSSLFPHLALALAAGALACPAAQAAPLNGAAETFKTDTGGWVGRIGPNGSGVTFIDDKHGDRRPSMRTQYDDFLKNGLRFYTDNWHWTGDYSVVPAFNFQVEVNTYTMQEGQGDITRDVMVYFLDFKHPPKDYDSISVGVKIGTLQMGTGWQLFTASVPDTTSATLPAGWVGTGALDKNGNSILPPGRTFAEVMANVGEVAIQTVPQANKLVLDYYDVGIDNIAISAVCPGDSSAPNLAKASAAKGPGSPFVPCN